MYGRQIILIGIRQLHRLIHELYKIDNMLLILENTSDSGNRINDRISLRIRTSLLLYACASR